VISEAHSRHRRANVGAGLTVSANGEPLRCRVVKDGQSSLSGAP
jgi:hypothetical protein